MTPADPVVAGLGGGSSGGGAGGTVQSGLGGGSTGGGGFGTVGGGGFTGLGGGTANGAGLSGRVNTGLNASVITGGGFTGLGGGTANGAGPSATTNPSLSSGFTVASGLGGGSSGTNYYGVSGVFGSVVGGANGTTGTSFALGTTAATVYPFVTGTAADGSAAVRQNNPTGVARFTVVPFPGFTGSLNVTQADVTGDGTADLVVGAGAGGGPRVAVFDGVTGGRVADFYAYESAFRGGVNVAAGDLTGDGRADVVTGAGDGGGPRVRAFRVLATAVTPAADFFAFESGFRGGVAVAVGATGTTQTGIVAGAGVGGSPRVSTFDAAGNPVTSFFAGDPAARTGVTLTGVAGGSGTAAGATGTTTSAVVTTVNGGSTVGVFSDRRGCRCGPSRRSRPRPRPPPGGRPWRPTA